MRTRTARLLGIALLILGVSSPAMADDHGNRRGGQGWWHTVRTWQGWQGWQRWRDPNGDRGRHLGHFKRNRDGNNPPPANAVGAPEIDPSSAAQGLGLLTGGLLVLRGRRRAAPEKDRE